MFYPLICHAPKKMTVEVQGCEQWTGEKKWSTVDGRQTRVQRTMYKVPCLRQAGKYEVWILNQVRP